MDNDRLAMGRDAVESMQTNLGRDEPRILASYGLIGAVLLFGAIGFVLDRSLSTTPWCLLAGLLVGLFVGFLALLRSLRR
jgi:F0F1-type ATP synthase assembly protein I